MLRNTVGAYSSYPQLSRIHCHGARESFVTLVWYRFGVPPFNGVYWQAWLGWQVTGNGLNGLGFLTFRFDHGARESFVTLVWYRFGVPPFNGVYWQAWLGWQVTGNGLNGLGFLTFRFDLCSFFTNLRLCSLPLELVVLIDQWTGVKWFWRCMRRLFVLYGLYNRCLKCHPPSLRPTPNG